MASRSRHFTSFFCIALTLAFSGGAAALAHQLLWTRRLIDLLGGSHEASARVFGVFFLGLALGSAAAAILIGSKNRKEARRGEAATGGTGHVGRTYGSTLASAVERKPWHFLAAMELGIGALALPVALLPWWTGWIWPTLGPDALTGMIGGWAKLAVSLVCLLPPSFCMGFFVPIVVRELAKARKADAGGPTLALYAANTLGGVAGLVFTVGFAIHAFGLLGSMLAASSLNLLVACGCVWLARHQPTAEQPECPAQETTQATVITRNLCRILAFGSGAAVLSVEVILITLLGLVVPISFYGPAAMLTLVILALAIGAAIVATPWLRGFDPAKALVTTFCASAIVLIISPWVFHALAEGFPSLVKANSTTGFALKLTALVSLSFGAAMVLAGMIFPLVTQLSEQTPSGKGARAWGWLLAWNGVGAFAGAELTYRYLLPAAGVHSALGWVACGYAIAAIMLAVIMKSRVASAVAAAATLAIIFATPKLNELPVVNPHVGFDVKEVLTGREGVVTVVELPGMGRGILLSNQYLLGSTSARAGQERQAHLPLLLHPAPRRVGFLGVATGSTPTGALAHSAVESLDAVEISPLVVRAARDHFTDLSGPLFTDPRARIIIEDGRTWFAACRAKYDVISADLFQPWGPGEGRLFSREHFTSIRAALAPGGLFCQWLPGHQLAPDEFDSIVATFADVFQHVEIFTRDFTPTNPTIALVGWNDGHLDWNTVATRCNHERRAGGILDPSMRHAEVIKLLHITTVMAGDVDAPINTLDNNRIELSAGRRQLRGQGSTNTMQYSTWLSWLRSQSSIPPLALRLHEAELRAFQNRMPLFRSQPGLELWMDLPATVRSDPDADWQLWPGSLRPR